MCDNSRGSPAWPRAPAQHVTGGTVSPGFRASLLLGVCNQCLHCILPSLTFVVTLSFQLLYLKIAGLLFPASDFRHPVVTPALVCLSQLLTKVRPSHGTAVPLRERGQAGAAHPKGPWGRVGSS